MYDSTGGGKRFRKFNGVNLAWWHSFKYAAKMIWQQFANEVWGPLWHCLYPGHTYYVKTGKLGSVLVHLLYVQLAYPSVEQALDDLLERDELTLRARAFADDMRYLMRVAIPVVPIF